MKYESPSMSKVCAAITLLVIALAMTVAGQETKQQATPSAPVKSSAAQKNSLGLSFTIRFKDGKSQFKPGEIIRLELAFASSQPHAYRLDSATYDRGGRLEIDAFHLTPEDVAADPLYDYFHNTPFGFMGGGLRGTPELESKPYLITAELNEWFRFDKPGKYRLYVMSGRISKVTPDGRMFGGENVPATSNAVEFEILPEDPAWSKQKLQEATALLDSGKNDEGRRAACRTLRFLDTAAATREMARRFRGTDSACEFEYYIGLVGTPHRALAVEEMEKMLAEPEFPVTSSFISALSHLRYFLENPAPLAPYPNGDKEREKLWQAEMQKRRDAHQQIVKNNLEQLSLTVPTKLKEAKAISLGTLLDYKGAYTNGKGASARDELLSSALMNVFYDLPGDRQYSILAYRWKQIESPEMLPLLRQIYEKPSPTNEELRDIALKRIYELAPDEGRQLIFKEIQSGHPRVRAKTLMLLPDQTLPELDETLAAQIENDIDTYSALVARYATRSILPRIQAAYADRIGKWACRIQTSLLTYFLRIDPNYGVEMLEKALASRNKAKDSRCYPSQLIELKGEYGTEEVKRVALAHLNDPQAEVMMSAAVFISRYGSQVDKQSLWNTLERWHERYNGHEEAVRAELKKDDSYIDAAMVEIELTRALARGHGWLISADDLKRLQQLCVGKQCKDEVASIINQADDRTISLSFSFTDDNLESSTIAQYNPMSIPELKEKLIQFPEGTTFTWSSANGDEKRAEELFTDLRAYLKEHGMKLEKVSAEK